MAYKVPTAHQQAQFKKYFNKPVNYFFDMHGFNPILLDEWLEVPNNQSTAEFIRKKYGLAAERLVWALLGE